jgi:hypothetical protein
VRHAAPMMHKCLGLHRCVKSHYELMSAHGIIHICPCGLSMKQLYHYSEASIIFVVTKAQCSTHW